MTNKTNIPTGYPVWANRYFGEVIGELLDEAFVSVAVEESLRTAQEEDDQRHNEGLEQSEQEAEETDEANLKEALRESVEQKKLEDKNRIESNKKEMQGAVETAKTITPVKPKFIGLIETFTKAELAFNKAEEGEHYGTAVELQGPLKNAAEGLVKVKDEHDQEVKAREEIENWRKADGVKVKEVLNLSSLPTVLRQPQSNLSSAYTTFDETANKSEYVEAKGLLDNVNGKLTKFQEAQQKLEQLKLEVEKQYAGLKGLSEALLLKDLDGDPLSLHGDLVGAANDYQEQFKQAEYGLAEGLLEPLGGALTKFQVAKEEQDKDKEMIEKNQKEMKADFETSKLLTPITPKFVELIKTFTEAEQGFVEMEKVKNYKEMIKAQVPLKNAAEALAQEKDEHDREVDAQSKIESWQKTNDVTLQKVAGYEQATPAVRSQLRQLRPLKLQFETQVDAQSYVTAAAVLPKLGKVVEELDKLTNDYDKAMLERKKVDEARNKLKDDFNKANGMPALTENLIKLKETLTSAEKDFDRLYNGGDYAKALAQVKNVETAVKEVLAAESEYNDANLLREKAQQEFEKSAPNLDEVKGIPQTLLEIKPLQSALNPLSVDFTKLMNARKYDEAFNKAVELGNKVESLLNLKSAAEQKEAIFREVRRLYATQVPGLKNARGAKPVTPELKTALKKMEEVNAKFMEFYSAFEFEEAQKHIKPLEEAIGKVLEYQTGGKKGDYEKAVTDGTRAAKAYQNIRNDHGTALYIYPYTPKLLKLREAVVNEFADFQSKYGQLQFVEALEAVGKLDRAIKALEAERSEYENEHQAKREECEKEWNDHVMEPYYQVQNFEPLTPSLQLQLNKLPGEYSTFESAMMEERWVDTLAALGTLRLTVEELLKLEGEHTSTGQELRDDYEEELDKEGGLTEKLGEAKKVVPDTAELKELSLELTSLIQAAEDAEINQRPGEIKAAYDKVGEAVAKIFAAKEANEQAEKDYNKEVATLQNDYDTVLKFEQGDLPEINDQLKQLQPLRDAHDTPAKVKNYVEALARFSPFKKLVEELVKREADYNQAKVERNECFGDEGKLDPEFEDAQTVRYGAGAVTPGMVEATEKFKIELEKYTNLKWAGKYAEAKKLLAANGPLHNAAKELAKKKTEENYDTVAPDKEAVDKEWEEKVKADYEKVQKFKPFTNELKTLLKTLADAHRQYDDTYAAYEYKKALLLLKASGALFEAVKALLDKEGDHANEANTADVAATKAASVIDDTDIEELKILSAEKQVELLKNLRGRQETLTEAERASQRKLYNAMKLDEEFVKEDDRKREEFIKQLRQDPKMKEAQQNWNDKPLSAEERVAVLKEVVQKQCALFGMDVPDIKIFHDIGDLEGGRDAGSFSPSTGNINLNTASWGFDDFAESLNTIAHENGHNYQAELVRRLNADPSEIDPSDPEYTQALLFAANNESGGYVNPTEASKHDQEGTNTYKKQPQEEHAFKTGDLVSQGFLAPESPLEGKK